MKKPMPVFNMHDESQKLIDPFDYLRSGMTKEEEETFQDKEQNFQQLMLLKQDYLTKTLWRELDYYKLVPRALPILIDNYIYYRRNDNPAEVLTLFRFPVDQLKQWHQDNLDLTSVAAINELLGDVPKYPKDPDVDADLSKKERL